MAPLVKIIPGMQADFELAVFAKESGLSLEKQHGRYTDKTTHTAWELWQAAYESCRRILSVNWQYEVTPNPDRGKQSYLVTLVHGRLSWVALRSYDPNTGLWMNGTDPELATVQAWAIPPEPAPFFPTKV